MHSHTQVGRLAIHTHRGGGSCVREKGIEVCGAMGRDWQWEGGGGLHRTVPHMEYVLPWMKDASFEAP